MRVRAFFTALALKVLIAPAAAQSVTEAESHILSAFSSRAEARILAENVKLGPALRRQLGGETGRDRIYAALSAQTAGKPLRVNALSPVEAALHAPLVGGELSEPLFRLEAGELALLMQYSAGQKEVVFVEQLSAPAPRAEPAPPPPAPPSPAPSEAAQLPAEPPKPAPVVGVPLPAAPPPPVQKPAPVSTVPKPMAPKVVEKPKPPSVASPAPSKPPTTPAALERLPAETKTQPSPPPTFRAAPAECEIKPVMTDDELRACGARR